MEKNTIQISIENENLPKTKQEAIALKCKSYFTGVPCANGHIDKRYTNTGICYCCKRQQNNRDYNINQEKHKKRNDKSRKKNYKRVTENNKKWIENNKEKSRQIKKNYKLRNKEKVQKSNREYQREKRKNPLFRLSRAMSKAMWAWLKKDKGFRHWETLVNFTADQLISHLENQFTPEMTWENYGKYWEVDHIKPISLCTTFEEIWNLGNLQPLTCFENRSKGNKYNPDQRENNVYK